jgi:hypothetical protein
MPKDSQLPDRFAKLLIGELADIHALLLNIHDYITTDIAERTGASSKEIEGSLELKRIARADRISADFLQRLKLPE